MILLGNIDLIAQVKNLNAPLSILTQILLYEKKTKIRLLFKKRLFLYIHFTLKTPTRN